MSFEEVRAAVLDRQNAIKSVRVTYDLTTQKLADDPFIPKEAVWGTRRITFVIEGNRRYLHLTPSNKSAKEFIASFDGNETLKWSGTRAFVVDGKLRECEGFELYCNTVLQLPYMDADKVNRENLWFLSYVLNLHKQEYRLRSKQEQIDGAWCYVLECPNRDIIWVDPQLGYAMRKRETLLVVDAAKGISRKQFEYTFRDFAEGAPGISVPKTATMVRFGRLVKDGPQVPVIEWKISVLEISLNQVQEKDFEVKIPPGTTVVKGNESFLVPGDRELLIKKFADLHAPPKPGMGPKSRNWILVINMLLLVILIVVFIARRLLRLGKVAP